ncbi:MAG TPA: thiamine pyrophosphate-binding protein, partial [Spirochaetota bacterium]|nr:thiamine pyrophosphate-binding protein [Spirochaetota bacterium]
MNISEYIFEFFSEKGIDTVFMITGGQAMFLDDAVGKNPQYKIICMHHEQSATMSADAYGRMKNKPAIALVTAGPGSVNTLTGVVGGYTDSSPMIVISGQANLSFVKYQNDTQIRQFGIQGINIRPLVEPVVKYFITIDDPKKVKYYLSKAFHEATTGRPGPVWIDVPLDIQNTAFEKAEQVEFIPPEIPEGRVSVKQAVKHTYDKLLSAKRPVFLVGQGVKLAGAQEVFNDLAEKLQIPVITARLGIDLIESDNRLYVGRPGNYGERSANFAIQNSDLIISVGCRLASSLVGHRPHEFGKHAYKIVVDIDQKELDKPGVAIDYKAELDGKQFFSRMLEESDKYKVPDYENWVNQCEYWKNTYPVVQREY